MISEPFATGESIIHRLDPRIRIVVATMYCFVIAFSEQFPVLLIAVVISSALTVKARRAKRRLGICRCRQTPGTGKRIDSALMGGGAGDLRRSAAISDRSVVPVPGGSGLGRPDYLKIQCDFTYIYRPDRNDDICHPGLCLKTAVGSGQNYPSSLDELPLYIRHRTGISAIDQGRKDTGVSTQNQFAYLPDLRLCHWHASGTGNLQGPSRTPGHALSRIQRYFLQSAGIQSRPGRFDIFSLNGRHHHRADLYGMVTEGIKIAYELQHPVNKP